ncbi:MAG: nucleotidyltransferase family protein [Methylomicrobium sp.]|nr:nucleotidyltransferase family protein [Methylomicrobium sp.]
MKAMIMAAGRGERMRPLTDRQPKPLLMVGAKPLIVHLLENLRDAGFSDIVINVAHLGSQIIDYLGDGHRFGMSISYSDEGETPLETAGGIIRALPLLGDKPFLVVNGDIATNFPFKTLKQREIDLAHLVLVNNPEHHPSGDFGFDGDLLSESVAEKYTFSGIGLYHPALFAENRQGTLKLAPILREAMRLNRVSGEKYNGFWMDIGTPQRLKELDHLYQQRGTHHV